jgi:hypothetical protein
MDETLLQAFKESGSALAPALGEIFNLWPYRKIRKELKFFDKVGGLSDDTRQSLLKLYYKKQWARQHDLDGTNRELIMQKTLRAWQAGGPIVAASLAGLPGVPHGRGLHREMHW